MNIRRLLAGACAVAGVFVLAGAGWALLAAATLLCIVPMPAQVATSWRRAAAIAGRSWRWLTTGRRPVAVASMPTSIALAGAGSSLAWSLGIGLVVMAIGIGAVSLLTGWNS